jgi:hypothetical protein
MGEADHLRHLFGCSCVSVVCLLSLRSRQELTVTLYLSAVLSETDQS